MSDPPSLPSESLGQRAAVWARSVLNGKTLGILGLLVAICVYTAICSDQFTSAGNIEKVVHRTALYGILAVGVAFVIITGGIDLSIGSMVCLVGVLLPFLVVEHDWHPAAGVAFVMALSVTAGLIHGTMITRMRLQPFVVTLCGLLIYRGIARGITNDQPQGFKTGYKGLRAIAKEMLPIIGNDYQIDDPAGVINVDVFQLPVTTFILIVVAVIAAVFLNRTIWGRYLLALGRNEQAARYSGIKTDRMVLLAYVICSTLAGLGGMLFVLDINDAQPSDFGNFYELYAIAASVLGGCSLRGGEGSIFGVLIGAAVIVVLSNMILLVYPQYQNIEFAIIGGVILAGVSTDEIIKRIAANRRAARQAEAQAS
jgi:ribose transport system permease protein